MAEFVTLEVSDGIGTIRLNRPPVNALDQQTRRELTAAAREAAEHPEVRAVIVYGGEKVFAAGDDVAELAELSVDQLRAMTADIQEALGAMASIPQPTVAAISGYALGGGLEIALGADRRIIGDNVKLGLPEILLGLIPVGGGTARLARLIGPSRAKDLIYTGRFVEPDEAKEIGLVDEVVAPDEVYNVALAWARQFVNGPARALAAAKAAIDAGVADGLEAGLAAERELIGEVFDTADRVAGVQSFLDNGPGQAQFSGT
ncbi:enoyl-CoA hydratase/isomerase family protein [Aldersonia kunmingensis]|uniref:enoyl-CoA hydratase/isomerase family protein n=1 Tax=Aldersonia kunmingensis TaxID=408066 RepID=UPI00082C9B8B|nr:enoyl-CoA hydratase-related protein [Aldersonia kunmingensis]